MRKIYDKFGDVLYCVRDDGTITDKWDIEVIGHLRGDRITDKWDIDTLCRVRDDGTITDKWDVEIIGRIRSDGTITDKHGVNKYGKMDVSKSTSTSTSFSEDYSGEGLFWLLIIVGVLGTVGYGLGCWLGFPPIIGAIVGGIVGLFVPFMLDYVFAFLGLIETIIHIIALAGIFGAVGYGLGCWLGFPPVIGVITGGFVGVFAPFILDYIFSFFDFAGKPIRIIVMVVIFGTVGYGLGCWLGFAPVIGAIVGGIIGVALVWHT